jgi:hypothetical protein
MSSDGVKKSTGDESNRRGAMRRYKGATGGYEVRGGSQRQCKWFVLTLKMVLSLIVTLLISRL